MKSLWLEWRRSWGIRGRRMRVSHVWVTPLSHPYECRPGSLSSFSPQYSCHLHGQYAHYTFKSLFVLHAVCQCLH